MARKIIAGILIIISSILLGLSIAGIVMAWTYKQPLTQVVTHRLRSIDDELGQGQAALRNAELELQRTLRTVIEAEKSLEKLKASFVQAKTLFGDVNGTLDKQLLPGLKSSRNNIEQAQSSLQSLRDTLQKINDLPFLGITISGDAVLGNLISSAGSLDAQIAQVETLVKKASTFLDDASYLMGGDFTETKTNLENFLVVVQQYDLKLTTWRGQLDMLLRSLPGWILTASIILTIFLAWFGLSQVSMILHGLSWWHGGSQQVKLTGLVVQNNPV